MNYRDTVWKYVFAFHVINKNSCYWVLFENPKNQFAQNTKNRRKNFVPHGTLNVTGRWISSACLFFFMSVKATDHPKFIDRFCCKTAKWGAKLVRRLTLCVLNECVSISMCTLRTILWNRVCPAGNPIRKATTSRPVSPMDSALDCCAGGRGFAPRPDQDSRS